MSGDLGISNGRLVGFAPADSDRLFQSKLSEGQSPALIANGRLLPGEGNPLHRSWDSFMDSWRIKMLALPGLNLALEPLSMTANLTPYNHRAQALPGGAVKYTVTMGKDNLDINRIVTDLDRDTHKSVKRIFIISPLLPSGLYPSMVDASREIRVFRNQNQAREWEKNNPYFNRP